MRLNRMHAPVLTASQKIARFVCDQKRLKLPEPAMHAGRRALLDTLASAIAGAGSATLPLLLAYVRRQSGQDLGSLWIGGERVSIEAAALFNGSIGHVLDFDDVTSPMRGHPSVVLWPALLALAEAEGSSGKATLDAYAIGLEVIAKIGRVVAIEHVAKGWHSTNTIGAIGTTAACAHLLNMSFEQVVSALGLAVAQIAGTRANFGTMAKSFQAGQAAASALRAVGLARLGFTAGEEALDGPSGFTALYCDGQSLGAELAQLGEVPWEIEKVGLDAKRFPNCYATHRTIQAVLALRERYSLTLKDVQAVTILTSARAQVPLIYSRPVSGLQGKFSLTYAVAAALRDGDITLSSFTDDMVMRREIQDFLPSISASEASGSPLPRWSDVTITMKDGRQLREKAEILKGSAADPLSDADLVEKLRACSLYSGQDFDIDGFANVILTIDEQSVAASLRPYFAGIKHTAMKA